MFARGRFSVMTFLDEKQSPSLQMGPSEQMELWELIVRCRAYIRITGQRDGIGRACSDGLVDSIDSWSGRFLERRDGSK